MRLLAVLLLALPLAASPAAAQGADWAYPRGERPNPLAPPAELYTGKAMPELRVTTIVHYPDQPERSLAILYVGEGSAAVRSAVRAGTRIGDLRVLRVEPEGVRVLVRVLGTVRPVFVTRGEDSSLAAF